MKISRSLETQRSSAWFIMVHPQKGTFLLGIKMVTHSLKRLRSMEPRERWNVCRLAEWKCCCRREPTGECLRNSCDRGDTVRNGGSFCLWIHERMCECFFPFDFVGWWVCVADRLLRSSGSLSCWNFVTVSLAQIAEELNWTLVTIYYNK